MGVHTVVPIVGAELPSFHYPEIVKKSKVVVYIYCLSGMLPWSLSRNLSDDSLQFPYRKMKLWKKWDVFYVCALVVFFSALYFVMFQGYIPNLQEDLSQFDADALTIILLAVDNFVTITLIWVSWLPRTSEFLKLWVFIKVKHIIS